MVSAVKAARFRTHNTNHPRALPAPLAPLTASATLISMASPSLYRPEFEAALRLFARASEAMHARGFERPVLVGGAAVELYSGSAITTGDFDLATGRQEAFEEELLRVGFIRPVGLGSFSRGLVHPDLKLGFEVVASAPFSGAFDRTTLALVEDFGDAAPFVVLSIEDLIADRMGQYASGTARDRLDQARVLFALHPDLDRAYLNRRIREETCGDHGIEDLS